MERLNEARAAKPWARPWHRSTHAVLDEVSRITGVSVAAIQSGAQGANVRRARGMCFHVIRAAGLSYEHIADLCDVYKGSVPQTMDDVRPAHRRIAREIAERLRSGHGTLRRRSNILHLADARRIVDAVAHEFNVAPEQIRSAERVQYSGRVAMARRVVAIALAKYLGNAQMASEFMGRSKGWAWTRVDQAGAEDEAMAAQIIARLTKGEAA